MRDGDPKAAPRTVAELMERLEGRLVLVSGDASASVASVEYDSRRVREGSLFVAVEGFSRDGHGYAASAAELGACAIVVSEERAGEFAPLAGKGCAVLAAKDGRRALSRISAAFFGFPSRKMKVIGVTGTNGKTSFTYMLESIAKAAGLSPGVIGTIDYRWKGAREAAPNTTPESRDLQELMARMASDGVDCLIMEVSSHGLELFRADDIDFDAAVFTNLSRDHLDFHHDFERYFSAKKKLFSILNRSVKKKKTGLVNLDDGYGVRVRESRADWGYPLLGYGIAADAEYRIQESSIVNRIDGLSYIADTPGGRAEVKLGMGGRFNVYNSLAALAAALEIGVPLRAALEGLEAMKTVPGRFDTIASPLGFHVIVDYAHTDDALRKLLMSVRELAPSRLITVFGCGGNRDRTKRPLMGKAAAELSDHVIVTSDNPRRERPGDIIDDILKGVSGTNWEVVPDRRAAIAGAVSMAKRGDIVVVAGKGHEDYQIIGEIKQHFDDRETVRELIDVREAR